MRPDNSRFLRHAEQQRHTRLLDQALSVLRRLDATGQPVTVAAVVRCLARLHLPPTRTRR